MHMASFGIPAKLGVLVVSRASEVHVWSNLISNGPQMSLRSAPEAPQWSKEQFKLSGWTNH